MALRTPLLLFSGAVLGAAIVVACGDDSPTDVDAADGGTSCDCPAAEPPLDGRITIRNLEAPVELSASSSGTQSLRCGVGETLLTGSCRLATMDPEVTLSEAGLDENSPDDIGWRCVWNNATPRANTGIVRVLCLSPSEE